MSVIYGFFSLVPHFCSGIAATLITMVLMAKIRLANEVSYWLYVLAITLLLMHGFIAYPGTMMLVGPLLSWFALCCIISAGSIKKNMHLIAAFVMILAVLWFSGFVHYFFGLFKYTAAVFFNKELFISRAGWYDTSVVFHYQHGGSIASVFLVLGGVLGALLDAFTATAFRKTFSRMFLGYVALIFLFGFIIINFYPMWQGPVPLYFEIVIWPLYAIYAANLLISLLQKSINMVKKIINIHTWLNSVLVGVLFPICMAAIVAIVYKQGIYHYGTGLIYTYPPVYSSMVSLLDNEVGLSKSSAFRGRVANFSGQDLEQANWFNLYTIDTNRMLKSGNELRLVGLNYYDIPSFFEYSPLLSPAFFMVTKAFLAYQQDDQMRNIMALRKPDIKILRLLGVKFFITDSPVNVDAKLHYTSQNPASYLYEIDQVNVGQYSPIHPLLETTAKSSLEKMAQREFDPQEFVVVHKPLTDNLVPATDAKMLIGKDGKVTVSATSAATSLLVLPIEYSHCLDLDHAMNDSNLSIFRVNLLQTGVLFQGKLNVTLSYFTGPWHNSRCRLEDIAEVKQLGM